MCINLAHLRRKFAAIITVFMLLVSVCYKYSSQNMDVVVVNSISPRMVRVPEDFGSIQKAINHASEGDTIFVKAGLYQESIILNKSITLLGESRNCTIIDSNRSSDVITVVSSNCVICGFTVRNGGLAVPAYCGIKLCNVNNVLICNNIITGNFIGIKLGNKQRGCTANTVANNNISGNRYGIFLDHSCGNIIYGNYITKNFWNGIELAWSNGNKIYNNTICYNGAYGLEIPLSTPSRYNIIYHNNFINNSRSAYASGYENIWDDGYPSGGNYWSDYVGVDNKFGVCQDLFGSDCVGDVPYVIDVNNKDNYPLTIPFALLSPVSDFVFYPDSPKIGETVTFTAFSVDRVHVIHYAWDFGDGGVAYGRVATHTYLSPGAFKVCLNVTNARGFSKNVVKVVVVKASYAAEDTMATIKRVFSLGVAMVTFIFSCWYFLKRYCLKQKSA